MSIKDNVAAIREKITEAAISSGRSPEDILLVAASKMNSADRVREAIAAGVTACGENRVQELTEKSAQEAYSGAQLHFIGHLQKNKVKSVVGVCDLIESIDSLELLSVIGRKASEKGIVQDVLLEVNIGKEASKSGIFYDDLGDILSKAGTISGIFVRGLMSIPPISVKKGDNREYFALMRKLFVDITQRKYDNVSMDFLSMGMSGDFEDAILEGANIVRVGSAIFGERKAADAKSVLSAD